MKIDEIELDDKTEARIQGLAQATDSKPNEIIAEALEAFSKNQGDQLVMMQGQQKIREQEIGENQVETEETEPVEDSE